jgi:hypothetical protein
MPLPAAGGRAKWNKLEIGGMGLAVLEQLESLSLSLFFSSFLFSPTSFVGLASDAIWGCHLLRSYYDLKYIVVLSMLSRLCRLGTFSGGLDNSGLGIPVVFE